MGKGSLVVAFSGGKDSTAMALRLAELGESFVCLFTPTGNELPELHAHIARVIVHIERPLIVPPGGRTLEDWMGEYNALPNWRQRWCTRLIKIVPCIAYLRAHPGSVLAVGLRADEETREGLYGDFATYRYPLREWGWEIHHVWEYVKASGFVPPRRTDCAWCYAQRLPEWYVLWRDYRAQYEEAIAWETRTGYTFRSPGRDTWPAGLASLAAEFAAGRVPRGQDRYEQDVQACRVCTL